MGTSAPVPQESSGRLSRTKFQIAQCKLGAEEGSPLTETYMKEAVRIPRPRGILETETKDKTKTMTFQKMLAWTDDSQEQNSAPQQRLGIRCNCVFP